MLISKTLHKHIKQNIGDRFAGLGTIWLVQSRLLTSLLLNYRNPFLKPLINWVILDPIILIGEIIDSLRRGRWNDLSVFIPIKKHYHSYADEGLSGWEYLAEVIDQAYWDVYYTIKHHPEFN